MKPEIILLLEKELKTEFDEIEENNFVFLEVGQKQAEYSTNEKGEIIGLFIFNLKLIKIPISLSDNLQLLNNLKYLYLGFNDLFNISFLKNLKNLTELYLGINKIEDFSFLKNLKKLTKLDLTSNNISEISFLKDLENLTELSLSNNSISDISFLKKNKNLTLLNLGFTNITDFSSLKDLNKLISLYLKNNKIKDISFLKNLKNIKYLDLSFNNISDISFIKKLKKLITLDLQWNKISELPKWITDFDMEIRLDNKGFGIILEDNPIETPPLEIVSQGNEAIKNYFDEIEKGTLKSYETKLLLVGYGAVGKTSLMKRLVFDKYNEDEKQTEGIDIETWNLKKENHNDLRINIWDFGGQEIYHSTHQFFLSKRSFYILVWDARIDQMMPDLASFEYWLRVVTLLSEKSPIILVQNKSDQRVSRIAEDYLQDYFPNIVGFYQVSAKTGEGVKELQDVIFKEINKLPHIGEPLPKVWVDIREKLKKTGKNYIKIDEYFSVCQSFGIYAEQALHLSNYFHDLGIFLHFQDNDILRNLIFLNPEWATKAVYKIIDTQEVIINNGKFNYSHLRKIWQDYPENKFVFLIELMKKFELCFILPNAVDYIVPGMLMPTNPKINWDITDNYQFEYRYKFMPNGVIPRLIVRMHDYIKDNIYWFRGLIVQYRDAEAIISTDRYERDINIKIRGKNKQELFSIIRYELDNINKTLKNPTLEILTHCTCNECYNSEKQEFYTFTLLNKYLDKGKNTITCPKSIEEVSINKLLGKINGEGQKNTLFNYMIAALKQLQGLVLSIQKYEDSRNSIVATMLTNKNYRVKDQTKWGIAKTQPGEIDIKIEDDKGIAFAICEAFNLTYFDKTKIKNHISKIFDYDVNGLSENYIIVYNDKNFMQNWQKYQDYVPKISYKHKILDFTDISNNKNIPAKIKVAIAKHEINNKQIKIYHIFVELSK